MDEGKLTFVHALINGTLFALKFVAGIASGSMAILADAINSMLDALYGFGIAVSIRRSHEKADRGHSFAHAKVEPAVGLAVALMSAVAAFIFLQAGLFSLFEEQPARILNWLIISSMIIAVIGKILLGYKTHKSGEKKNNVAMIASAADSRSDILVTMIALLGVVFASTGVPWMDSAATIVISVFLFREAYLLGRRNMDYLSGVSPPPIHLHEIREVTSHVRGVRGIHQISAHYVHHYAHVQVLIGVNGNITAKAANTIAHHVQLAVEQLPHVSKAFVAIEPA